MMGFWVLVMVFPNVSCKYCGVFEDEVFFDPNCSDQLLLSEKDVDSNYTDYMLLLSFTRIIHPRQIIIHLSFIDHSQQESAYDELSFTCYLYWFPPVDKHPNNPWTWFRTVFRNPNDMVLLTVTSFENDLSFLIGCRMFKVFSKLDQVHFGVT